MFVAWELKLVTPFFREPTKDILEWSVECKQWEHFDHCRVDTSVVCLYTCNIQCSALYPLIMYGPKLAYRNCVFAKYYVILCGP